MLYLYFPLQMNILLKEGQVCSWKKHLMSATKLNCFRTRIEMNKELLKRHTTYPHFHFVIEIGMVILKFQLGQ